MYISDDIIIPLPLFYANPWFFFKIRDWLSCGTPWRKWKSEGCTEHTAWQKIPQGSHMAAKIVLAILYHKDYVYTKENLNYVGQEAGGASAM